MRGAVATPFALLRAIASAKFPPAFTFVPIVCFLLSVRLGWTSESGISYHPHGTQGPPKAPVSLVRLRRSPRQAAIAWERGTPCHRGTFAATIDPTLTRYPATL